MRRLGTTAALLGLLAAMPALAWAQDFGSGGSVASGAGAGAGSTPQPRPRVPDFAPPAVPGAGGATLSTMPPVPKVDTGDPTTELFAAVNGGDYNGARDAVARGADMTATNALGETPLDLSIALNRNSITFMLLNARNESGGDSGGAPVAAAATPVGAAPVTRARPLHSIPASMSPPPPRALPVQTPGNDPGTPNTAAGFLGFGQH